MTGSWQAEAVLAAACLAAAIALLRPPRSLAARWVAVALVGLAAAALLGAALFAGIAPRLGPAHDIASQLFATAGFAIVAVALLDGTAWRRSLAAAATVMLALAGLAIPLPPIILLVHAVAGWRQPPRRGHQALALAAMLAVIAGQLALPPGTARLDLLHLTLAAWALTLMLALP